MKKEKIKGKGKKFMALVVVFSLVIFSGNLMAKERKYGAELLIQKKDGQIIRGELLTVKQKSLLLIGSVSLTGVSVDISDIRVITIVKRSKFFKGAGYGFLIGGGIGALFGLASSSGDDGWFNPSPGALALVGGIFFGAIGAASGGIYGAIKGTDETIQIEGRTQSEVDLILKKFNSLARFQTEVPKNFKRALVPSQQEKQKEPQEARKKAESSLKQTEIEKEFDTKPASFKFSRIHLTVEPGYFNSSAVGDLKDLIESIGFGEDEHYSGGFFGGDSGVIEYPDVTKNPVIYIKDVRLEYSLSRKFSVGFAYFPLGSHRISGRKTIPGKDYRDWVLPEIYFQGKLEGNSYFITGSYMNVPDAFIKKHSFKLGVGLGYQKTKIDFFTSEYKIWSEEDEGQIFEKVSFSNNGLCFLAFGEYDYYFNRHWSIGVNIDYKYIPYKMKAFQLRGGYHYWKDSYNLLHDSILIDVPAHNVNFGGFGFGINLGLHF
jgi:hypothetical protein